MKEPHWSSGYASKRFRDFVGDTSSGYRQQRKPTHPKGEHWIAIKNAPADIYERLRTARSLNYGFGAEGLIVNFRSAERAVIFVMSNDLEYVLPSSD